MTRREERYLEEVEDAARCFWRMVKTGWHNRSVVETGSANPYLNSLAADMEQRYPWLNVLEGEG